MICLLIFLIILAILIFVLSLVGGAVWLLFGDVIVFVVFICIICKILKLFKGKEKK
jgi:hypothetical protein